MTLTALNDYALTLYCSDSKDEWLGDIHEGELAWEERAIFKVDKPLSGMELQSQRGQWLVAEMRLKDHPVAPLSTHGMILTKARASSRRGGRMDEKGSRRGGPARTECRPDSVLETQNNRVAMRDDRRSKKHHLTVVDPRARLSSFAASFPRSLPLGALPPICFSCRSRVVQRKHAPPLLVRTGRARVRAKATGRLLAIRCRASFDLLTRRVSASLYRFETGTGVKTMDHVA